MTSPSSRLVTGRNLMQREFDRYQRAAGDHVSYGPGVAQWLVSQLPGADASQLGWGILAVTALLTPGPLAAPGASPPRRPGVRGGARTSMVLASRVGEALLATPRPRGPANDGDVVVGPELASVDMSQVYPQVAGVPWVAAGAGQAGLRRDFHRARAAELREIRRCLVDELPGANLKAIGWALIATGMSLLVQAGKTAPPRRLSPGMRRRANARTSVMRNALFLAAVGDYLVEPAA